MPDTLQRLHNTSPGAARAFIRQAAATMPTSERGAQAAVNALHEVARDYRTLSCPERAEMAEVEAGLIATAWGL